MSNAFYNQTGYPGYSANGDSASMRSELAAIAAGFDKLPTLSALRLIRVNAAGTALESVFLSSAELAAIITDETGSDKLVFSQSPTFTGTPLAPTAVAGTNTTQLATTAHVFAERSNSATLTNKSLTSPTITGTLTMTGASITGNPTVAFGDITGFNATGYNTLILNGGSGGSVTFKDNSVAAGEAYANASEIALTHGTKSNFYINGSSKGYFDSTSLTLANSVNLAFGTGASITGSPISTLGATSVTSLTSSGAVTSNVGNNSLAFDSATTATTGYVYGRIGNGTASMRWGVEGSTAGSIVTGSTAYAGFIGSVANKPFQIASNNTVVGSFSSTGLVVTGTVSSTGNSATNILNDFYNTNTTSGANVRIRLGNDASTAGLRMDSSATPSTGNALQIYNTSTYPILITAGGVTSTFSSTGLAVTGSVSATGNSYFGQAPSSLSGYPIYSKTTTPNSAGIYSWAAAATGNGTGGSFEASGGTAGVNNGVLTYANGGATNYGLHDTSPAGATNYGIYVDSAKSYFGGGLSVAGIVTPEADNTRTLGSASLRWSTVYAGTGTINTSDAREKTEVTALTTDEINAAKQLSKEVGSYKWLSSISEKGDLARKHIGLTVQRAIEIMKSNNLDPMAYGFICYDKWDAEATIPAGDRYAFRYDELIMFISAGFEARLTAAGI